MPPRCPHVEPLLAASASVAAGGLAFACSRQDSHHSVLILNKECVLIWEGLSHQVISEFLLKGKAGFCFVLFSLFPSFNMIPAILFLLKY